MMAQAMSNCSAIVALAIFSQLIACIMADRPAKLQRLDEFRRSKTHCSASVMAQILTDVKKHGLPDLTDRDSMRLARDLEVSTSATYGPILCYMECKKAGTDETVKIPIANPFASLAAAIAECANFRRYFRDRLRLHPSTPEAPWSIVLYCDEVTPGNPLATANARKFQALYWTFLELGSIALSHEESWFTVMTEFSTAINALAGGLSHAFAQVIKLFFVEDGFNFATAGILLNFDGEAIRLWASICVIMQDDGAHKAVWQHRGDSASKFCLLCKNLFTDESNVVQEDGSRLLRSSVIKLDGLEASTDAELRTNARYLEQKARTVHGEAFKQLQQAIGLTYAPNGILLDRKLDSILSPTSVYLHDYMHLLYVDGVLNRVIYLLFEVAIQAGHTTVYQSFADYLGHWKYPGKVHSDHLADIFANDRRDKHRKAQHIKCQASDCL